MALKVVYINRKELNLKAEANAFWENVLKPKWEKRDRESAKKFLLELQSGGKLRWPNSRGQKNLLNLEINYGSEKVKREPPQV